MQWNKTTDVYLILTAKNLGRWVHHFIKNMENIVQETNDEHLHVIIYDFDSGDIDIKRAFQRTILKNYHFITKPGKYSRVTSLKEAIESVNNPDSIVVTIDMHLDIGSQFIDEIRKVSYLLLQLFVYMMYAYFVLVLAFDFLFNNNHPRNLSFKSHNRRWFVQTDNASCPRLDTKDKLDPVPSVNSCPRGFCCCVKLDISYQV